MFDIYRNRNTLKLTILLIAVVIGTASIWYTNRLVERLAEGERRQIDLYAKGLKSITDPNTDGAGMGLIFEEIINANRSIPVILADENGYPLSHKNVDVSKGLSKKAEEAFFKKEIEEMKLQHEPIVIEFAGLKNFIYYKNSKLLTQLKYYPWIQLTIIGVFGVLAYLAFSYSRRSEQNRVWVGMAKETAHQLGTPLSSLMAWVEIFKADPNIDDTIVQELEKDVDRLEMITSRFSNIGSVPVLKEEDLPESINATLKYLQARVSGKISIRLVNHLGADSMVKFNKALFEWVIENLVKNAVDAIEEAGEINVILSKGNGGKILIDIQDTGKGMNKVVARNVFKPGFTTKSRGWGLGLTLVKRIVENYHEGKISVLNSAPGVGTTFRIIL